MGKLPKNVQIAQAFPRLRDDNHDVTSAKTGNYNCIAWAADENTKKWWPAPPPDAYWPPGVPRTETLEAFVKAYETLGYRSCADGSLEDGVEKIAIFTLNGLPKHAAKQIDARYWTSKLGREEDISHERDALSGPVYGDIAAYMSRPKKA